MYSGVPTYYYYWIEDGNTGEVYKNNDYQFVPVAEDSNIQIDLYSTYPTSASGYGYIVTNLETQLGSESEIQADSSGGLNEVID